MEIQGDLIRVGKTALMHQYMEKTFISNFKPTIGADFLSKDILIEDKAVTFQLWDTAGQERYQSLGSAFYKGADGCVLVYDISDSKSFESIAKWREDFLSQVSTKDPSKFPFVLLGNKVDKESERKVPSVQALTFCKQFQNIQYFETSAKDGTNVKESFESISKQAIENQSSKY